MERGATGLVRIMAGALLMGLAILLVRPEYRAAVMCLWRGHADASPIWRSNARYYPAIGADARDIRGN